MKRRSVFAWLAGFCGVASAQEVGKFVQGRPADHPAQLSQNYFITKLESAANNQCPVCGTMAEAFKPEPRPFCGDAVVMMPDGKNLSGCDKSLLPKEQIARCKRCNAAFWQDAK